MLLSLPPCLQVANIFTLLLHRSLTVDISHIYSTTRKEARIDTVPISLWRLFLLFLYQAL